TKFLRYQFRAYMNLRLSSFTLFPYTTLFRSGAKSMGGEVSANLREQVLVVVKRASFEFGEDVAHALQSVSETAQRVERGALYVQDRKSTRLNSSHVKISYAVFCFKKKNTIN